MVQQQESIRYPVRLRAKQCVPGFKDSWRELRRQLHEFAGIGAVGLIRREIGAVRPLLEIAVYWSGSLSDADATHGRQRLRDSYGQFAEAISSDYDCTLDHYDRDVCPDLEAFEATLTALAARPGAHLLVSARFVDAHGHRQTAP